MTLSALAEQENQNKIKKHLDQSLLNLYGTIEDGEFFYIKKKLKNTGISITKSLTGKRMEMLNKAKERFGFRNVWTLDGRIYYLAEGSTKPQIFRN